MTIVMTNRQPPMIEQLRESLKGEVLDDAYSRGMYATDASIYQISLVAVALPHDVADVKRAVEIARAHRVKILPRGGGTSLAGQTVGDALVLDFSKYMNNSLEINAAERWVRVQPGLARDGLNEVLAPYGLHFAPDPATSSRANVGGMVGNNSSGTKSILYGKTVDHIIAARTLLADGTEMSLETLDPEAYAHKAQAETREGEVYRTFQEIIQRNKEEIKQRFPKVMRRVGGYPLDEFVYTDHWNLAKLITGSEGTLATTLELTLNLEPLPQHKSVAVVLFADTYLNFHEPQIGVSALQLLNVCGYEVLLANVGCCQRPKISHGFLRDAKKEGAQTLVGLKNYLDEGLTVVVCEPSCASALNDDLPDLIEDQALATQLSQQVMMIDVFLAREIAEGRLDKEFESIGGDILIHGHCHQKVLYGTQGMKLIGEKTKRSVAEIPSGCCGMAGSFGYETEHYELSQKIGESVLFPAVKAMKTGTTLVANGFSCRHQIEHFTGVKPKHWVEVIQVKR